MSIYNQLGAMRNDGVLGDGEGNVLPLTRYSKDELIGITFYYGIRLGNPNNKSKKQLIKTIQANREYQRRVRKEENNPRVNPVLRRTANKIIKELRKEAEEERRLVDPDPRDLELLDEVELEEKGTDISYTIMEKANQTSGTDSDWYANELRSELSLAGMEMGVNEIRPGDFIFFGYTARYPERYPYYDRRPLSFVLDMKGDKMFGCNVHYLNPDIRDSFALTMINKTAIQVPKVFEKTLHSYFYTNISGVYRIPENEYGDIARLVTEDFVDSDGMPVDLNAVWDSVN